MFRSMSNLSNIKQKFKSLFNDELLADEGWSAYIDLLLRNLDTSFLQFCRLNGFPHSIKLSDYYTRSDKEGVVTYTSDMFDISLSNNVVVLTYPNKYEVNSNGDRILKDPSEIEYFDFGNVDVKFNGLKILKAEVFQDGVWVEIYTYNYENKKGFGDTYFEISGETEFRLTFYDEEDGVVYYPELELLYLPESIDPASIVSYKKENFLALDKNNPPTSPQALFGVLAKLLGRYKFYVQFRTEAGSGSRQKSFNDYVTLYDVVKHGGDDADSIPAHFHAVTASNCPIDALRDRFGVGLQTSAIYGYDKKYLVAKDNTILDELIALLCDSTPNPGDKAEIMVSPSELNLPQHVDVVKLTPPTLMSEGATKNTEGSGWKFNISMTTTDVNAKGSYLGYTDKAGQRVVVYGPGNPSNVFSVLIEEARAGDTYVFWAYSEAIQGTEYINSDEVTVSVTTDKVLYPPVLTLSGNIGDKITITASWGEVENAQKYQVFYRKQGSESWTSLEVTTNLTVTFEVPDVGTYEVYVEAQADGFDSVPSDVETVTLSEVKLPSPSIRWELGGTFPQTKLTIGAMEHSVGFKYRITNGSVVTSWKDAVAGENLNVGEIVVGNNTIDVYAVGDTGYGDSYWSTETLVGVKLETPQLEVTTDLLAMKSTASWPAVSGATSYIVTVDTQLSVEVTGLSHQFDVNEGQHQVTVYAKGTNVFDSDLATKSFNVGSSEFSLSSAQMDFLQRENSGIVGLTAAGAYEGAWGVQDSEDVATRSAKALKQEKEVEVSVPVTGKVLVSTNPPTDFTIVRSEAHEPTFMRCALAAYNEKGELTYVCSPESKRSKTEFGIVKNYSMLSLVTGQLKSVDVYIEALKSSLQSEFGDRFEKFEEALVDVLKHSVPAGVGFTVNYLYPSLESTLKISDNYFGTSSGIFIEGGKEFTINFPQRRKSQEIRVFTIPPTMAWDAKDADES